MNLQQATFNAQSQLAAFCRTGNYSPIQGVNEKHVHQYRRLVFNVVEDSLQSAYPLTHNLLTAQEWDGLVNIFFSEHECQSPQVWQMPGELIPFMENTNHPLLEKYVCLKDLLLFEWLEVEVYMMEDLEATPFKTKGDLKNDKLVLNQELKILMLNYPVHLKNASEITEEDQGQYFACMHRDPESGRVEFSNLQYPHVELIEHLSNQPINYKDAFQLFLKYTTEYEASHALNGFIQASLESKLILGFD
mgnify:CR=1 FL=1